jgi:hypothetical protein
VNAGTAAKIGLKPGDEVVFPGLLNTAKQRERVPAAP